MWLRKSRSLVTSMLFALQHKQTDELVEVEVEKWQELKLRGPPKILKPEILESYAERKKKTYNQLRDLNLPAIQYMIAIDTSYSSAGLHVSKYTEPYQSSGFKKDWT